MNFEDAIRNTVFASQLVPNGVRATMLRRMGMKLGPNTAVASGATFKGVRVTTGRGCFINHEVYVDRGELVLGDNVFVGPRVTFATRNHALGDSNRRAGENVDQPIVVGTGAWIGAGATVLGNVVIAPGCVVAAGAVVTRNTEADGLYAGVPAVRVRDLP